MSLVNEDEGLLKSLKKSIDRENFDSTVLLYILEELKQIRKKLK